MTRNPVETSVPSLALPIPRPHPQNALSLPIPLALQPLLSVTSRFRRTPKKNHMRWCSSRIPRPGTALPPQTMKAPLGFVQPGNRMFQANSLPLSQRSTLRIQHYWTKVSICAAYTYGILH